MKDIKLEQIKLNFKYKNLKELCKITKQEYKDNTNSRKKIIKELECYLKLEKVGRGYIITEIYDKPKSKVDGRGKNPNSHHNQNGLYGKYIDTTLIKLLSNLQNISNKDMYFTTSVLAEYTYMVNINYITSKNNREKFYNYLHNCNDKINPTEVKDVLLSLGDTIRSVINSSLDRLQKQNIISYTKGYIIIEKEHEWSNKTRMATLVEEENIKIWENEILEQMKTTKGKLRFSSKKMNKFYFDLNNKIKEEYPHIEQIFQGYKIKVLKNIEILDTEFEYAKEKLNKTVIEETIKKCENQYIKTAKEKGNYMGKSNPSWDKWDLDRLNNNYLSNAKEIINKIVRIGVKDITREIKDTKVVRYNSNKNNKITKQSMETFFKTEANGDIEYEKTLREIYKKEYEEASIF